MCSWFFCYQLYPHPALRRPHNAIPVQVLGKIIKKFSDLSVFPVYVIVIFNLDIGVFFRFYSSNSQLMAKIDLLFLGIKPEKWIKSKKYNDFGQPGKISVQLDDDYYQNGENAIIRKFMIIFAKMWTEKWKLW